MSHFIVSQHHLDLLPRLEFDWDGAIEFGAVCSDFKRPFGNSGVIDDIVEILGVERCTELFGAEEPTWAQARALVGDLASVVNEIVRRALAGEIGPLVGVEVKRTWRNECQWRRKEPRP